MKKFISVTLTLFLILSLIPVVSPDATAASVVSRVSRDDGTWLFPLSSSYWNSFTDWAGCTGTDTYCSLCGGNHSTDGWGDSAHGGQGGHNGIDIAASSGTPVYAAASGKVYWGSDGVRGNYVIIEHTCDASYSYYSYYQHLASIYSFSWGQEISAGTTIATVGNTGSSGGSHLHFGIVMAAKGTITSSTGLGSAESYGWITTAGNRTGRILNNPAADSSIPTKDAYGGTYVIEPLKYHAGSVRYTFDKSQVAVGKSSPIPSSVWLTTSSKTGNSQSTITLNWGADNASKYWLGIYKDGTDASNLIVNKNFTTTSYSRTYPVGTYYVAVAAINSSGEASAYADFVISDSCTHNYGTWTTAKSPTCVATGTESRTCSICGATESRTINALGHSYSSGACTRCGAGDPNYIKPVAKSVHFQKQTIYFQDQFTDVPANQWFTDNVANAVEFGLMKGNSDTSFNPYGDVTLAEAITMAARIHSIYTTGAENFVQNGKWYQVYLDYAYQNGIISYAYYNCDVTKKATRAQFAEIFAAALPSEALGEINTIADNAVPDVKTSASCGSAVYKLYRAGILSGGDATGTFSPATFITRAECATIVARMADSDNRVQFSL